MNPSLRHPARAQLVAFAVGRLSGHELSDVEQHVQQCDDCAATVEGFFNETTFLKNVRHAHGEASEKLTESDSAAPPEHPERIGRYRIEKLLGKGGFGLVYLAHDEQLDRLVAVKVPHAKRISRPEDAEAYLEEARTVANLDHPHIVPVHDVGSTDECCCYVVSKYVEGTDLSKKLKQHRFKYAESAELVATVAEALHYAHKQGLVHRDVKPGNILIDGDGKPYVVDFGMALRDENIGKGPEYAGTPAYMSPEQARGEGHRVDGRSDIFSLGVVFYELLVRRQPFRADTQAELLELVTSHEPRPPRQYDDRIPKELERICHKAIAKRGTERYSTAKDMAEDLRHFLAQQTTPQSGATPSSIASVASETQASTPTSTSAVGLGSSSDSQPIRIVPKGLRSFDAHDADFFLELLPGPRDREGLPDSLRFWKTRIEEPDPDNAFSVGLIYGPSGCGKSSLVKAGLLPGLSEDVIPVYIESTQDETETHLLHGLRKRCPALEDNLSLKDALAALRRGQGIPVGRKVLIVLDQFEQWLHAKKEEENTDLVQALRQCDGDRVQCIVMVRDDFWMAATRFMRELEIRLVEAQNSAAVDLFPIRHAEKVLAAFGRAFGTLPDNVSDTTKEQKDFLKLSVAGLSEEGKVICVRLALFAEMMKGKTWTPATLKEVGGTKGVGVTFLEETFSASTSPPQHRYHQKAARAVLKDLLPDSGRDIKGHMRSHAELLEASGYGNRPKDFDDLIRILDSEIRLITPTDPEGKDSDDDSETQTQAGQKYFQLTHDYLVHLLRDWLTRKQKETRRGRAELKLFDTSVTWNAKPENRFLPSWWEHLIIRLLTDKKKWTEPQRKMMGKVGRVQGIRSIFVLAALIGIVFGGITIRNDANEKQNNAEATRLVEGLLQADTSQVKTIIGNLADYRQWGKDDLQKAFTDSPDDSNAKLHAALAMLPEDNSVLPFLKEQLLTVTPMQFEPVRNLLDKHKTNLTADYWKIAKDSAQDPARRFRAACALASYDPDNKHWQDQNYAEFVDGFLVGVLPSELLPWRNALRPVKDHLIAPLAAIYRDSEKGEQVRGFATDTLADYLSTDAEGLFDLLADANQKQFAAIFGKLTAHREPAVELGNIKVSKERLPVRTNWTVRFYSWESAENEPPADWEAVLKSPVLDELQTPRLSFYSPPPPTDKVPQNEFAVVATTEVTLGDSEYALTITFDDGVRVWLDDEQVFENWGSNNTTETVMIQGKQGRQKLKVEYFQIGGAYALEVGIDVSDDDKEALAMRQANAAVMLLRMNAAEKVWPLLKHSPDPRVRSYIIHWLGPRGGDPNTIISRYEQETDVTIKRALLLCLGEFDLTANEQGPMIETLLTAYRTNPDAGLHAAAEWLLRQWDVTLPELPVGEPDLPDDQKQRHAKLIADVDDIRKRIAESEKQLPVRQAAWERKLSERPAPAASLSEGLVAHFPLDETEGTETANAVEGQTGGTYQGLGQPEWVPGVLGNGLQFIGESEIVGSTPLNLESDTPFSYGCWFYNEITPRVLISTRNEHKGFRGFDLSIEDGNHLQVVLAGEPSEMADAEREVWSPLHLLVQTTSVVLSHEWHHVLATYDGSKQAQGVTIYVDGRRVPTRSGRDALDGTIRSDVPVHVGSRHGGYRFKGRIDDVRIYNRRLSEEEVSQLFESGLRALASVPVETRTPDQQALLAATYRFEDEPLQRLDIQLAAAEAALRTAMHEEVLLGMRRWYVNSQGQTFVILGAGEFQMGSPESEADRNPNERLHRRKIGRRIAISTKEVTRAQWRVFAKSQKLYVSADSYNTIRTDDSPMTAMTWYQAAHYCNWLSEQEGILKQQWCYEPNDKKQYGPGMKAKANFLELTGYRLPTEAEWEFACRAGANTSRYYGLTERLLPNYAWYQVNGDNHTWPVASLKPNDFGLFDMQGNAQEWCYDAHSGYPYGSKDAAADATKTEAVSETDGRMLRGGSFYDQASLVRSAVRISFLAGAADSFNGFRPSRTYHLFP